MFRILESQAPAKQSAEDTISTLSGRLQSATLLEDRRAAILGLRSFAKLYPASVASGALRNLINTLGSDGEDVDTTKVVLETLLMLFSPDESSPEASDDIALWLADEFTQVPSAAPTTSALLSPVKAPREHHNSPGPPRPSRFLLATVLPAANIGHLVGEARTDPRVRLHCPARCLPAGCCSRRQARRSSCW